MTLAVILLSIWILIVFGSGCLINHLFGLTGIISLMSVSGVIVTILEAIFILIGVIVFLIYLWSCNVTLKLESKIDKAGKKLNKQVTNLKEQNREHIENLKDCKDKAVKNTKEWYNNSWFAIEDIDDDN